MACKISPVNCGFTCLLDKQSADSVTLHAAGANAQELHYAQSKTAAGCTCLVVMTAMALSTTATT